MDDLSLWRLREAVANKWDTTNVVMKRGDLVQLLAAYARDHEARRLFESTYGRLHDA